MTKLQTINATVVTNKIGKKQTAEFEAMDAELLKDLVELDQIMAETFPMPITSKEFKASKKLLRLMDSIHNDIATQLNNTRKATLRLFFREEDKYIPDSIVNNHLKLMMEVGA